MKTVLMTEVDLPDIYPAVVAASLALGLGVTVYGFDDNDERWNGPQYYLRRDADVVTALKDDYDPTPITNPYVMELMQEQFDALPENVQGTLRELCRANKAGELDGDGFLGYQTGWNVAYLSKDKDIALEMLEAYVKHQKELYPDLTVYLDRGGERL